MKQSNPSARQTLAFATPTERRIDLPLRTRLASVEPASLNAEQRTIELVWSTGANVRRVDMWNDREYYEELVVTPEACDLSRLNSGAPLLDSHWRFGLAGQIGVIERAWIANGEGRAVARFSARAEVEPIWQDIRTGIIRNVSVGYQVRKYEISKLDDQIELWRAVDWQPHEISMVAVGADAGAGTRSAGSPTMPCIIVNRSAAADHNPEVRMDKTETKAGAPSADSTTKTTQTESSAAPASPPDTAALTRAAVEVERKRGGTIRRRIDELVRTGSLTAEAGQEIGDDLIERGIAVEHVGDRLIDEIAKRGSGTVSRGRVEGGADHTDPAEIRSAMAQALAARAAEQMPIRIGEKRPDVKMEGRARDYAGLGALDMLAEYARAVGEKIDPRLPRAAMFDRLVQCRSLSTSDFPIILADAQNKIMVQAYQLAAPTYRSFMARKTFNDFKAHKFIRAGDFPTLLLMGETGEVQYGAMSETKQEITLATYARAIRLTRRMLINDDLAAFADLPGKAGRRIADFENQTAFAQFALNSGDGPSITETTRALWNTTDVTKSSSGAAITIAAVNAGRAAMRKKTSLDGMKLNVGPRILLTSPDKETEAQQFVSQNLLPQQTSNVNPFAGTLMPLADANLTGNGWYLFADPADLETFIYGYLAGAEGPRLMTDEPFTTDGVALKVTLDFVAGAIDFRGTWKDTGA